MRQRGILRDVAIVVFSVALVVFCTGCDNIFPSSNYRNGDTDCDDGSFFDGQLCLADNYYHEFFNDDLPSGWQTATVNAFTASGGYNNNTDIYGFETHDPEKSASGTAETDIIFQSADLGEGTYGASWCEDAWTGARCDQHYTALNKEVCDWTSCTTTRLRFATCHEIGHTFGLLHGSNATPKQSDFDDALACMQRVTSGLPDHGPYLGTQNRDNLNANY